MGTNIQFLGVFIFLFLGVIAYWIKPRHVGIRFSRTPPVIARVNAPSKGATDEQRVISLPTGDAAILHDYLYRNPVDEFARSLPRETVDRVFYWGMRARGVWRLTAGFMYLGVRIGGWVSYKRMPRSG